MSSIDPVFFIVHLSNNTKYYISLLSVDRIEKFTDFTKHYDKITLYFHMKNGMCVNLNQLGEEKAEAILEGFKIIKKAEIVEFLKCEVTPNGN